MLSPLLSADIEAQEILPPQARVMVVDDSLQPGSTARIVRSAMLVNAGSRAAASGAALNLLQETLQPTPRIIGNAALPAAVPQNGRSDNVTFHTNTPPPFRRALPSAQPVAAPSIASGAPLATTAHHRSKIPMPRSRARPCCRWRHWRIASLPQAYGWIPLRSAGISRFRLRCRRGRRWRSSRFRATAAATRSKPQNGCGARGSRSTSSPRARFMRWYRSAATGHRCGCGRNGRRPRRNCALAPRSQALSKAELQPGDIVIREGAPPAAGAGARGAFSESRAMSVERRNQLAVALHCDKKGAPRVVARGSGPIGAKIVELARAHDIPIKENEVLAGALSNVELGDEIPAELYKAVAEVPVFVLRLSGRIR
jgi:flagellar biosynthesis protein